MDRSSLPAPGHLAGDEARADAGVPRVVYCGVALAERMLRFRSGNAGALAQRKA
jgi:hypothetical protein